MRKELYIIGASGFGREVLQLVQDCDDHRYEVKGFIDSDASKAGISVAGLPVCGDLSFLLQRSRVSGQRVAAVLGIGTPVPRFRITEEVGNSVEWPSFIHPTVTMGREVKTGKGVLITAGTILTVDISVEDFAALNLACTVGHDAVIGRYSVVNPGVQISGNAQIGEGVLLGTGSTILQQLSVGAWSVVGGGALVHEAIPANVTAVGVPAKVIKERSAGWHKA